MYLRLDYIFISEQDKIVFINNSYYFRSFFILSEVKRHCWSTKEVVWIDSLNYRQVCSCQSDNPFNYPLQVRLIVHILTYRNMNKLNLSWILKDL